MSDSNQINELLEGETSRRSLLRAMGAAGIAGLAGCGSDKQDQSTPDSSTPTEAVTTGNGDRNPPTEEEPEDPSTETATETSGTDLRAELIWDTLPARNEFVDIAYDNDTYVDRDSPITEYETRVHRPRDARNALSERGIQKINQHSLHQVFGRGFLNDPDITDIAYRTRTIPELGWEQLEIPGSEAKARIEDNFSDGSLKAKGSTETGRTIYYVEGFLDKKTESEYDVQIGVGDNEGEADLIWSGTGGYFRGEDGRKNAEKGFQLLDETTSDLGSMDDLTESDIEAGSQQKQDLMEFLRNEFGNSHGFGAITGTRTDKNEAQYTRIEYDGAQAKVYDGYVGVRDGERQILREDFRDGGDVSVIRAFPFML